MDHSITWNDYINVRLAIWAGGVILALIYGTVQALIQLHEDRHVNDESESLSETAGKTLFRGTE